MYLTVVAPRKDMGDRHRNLVQEHTRTRMGFVAYQTGWYPYRPVDGPWSMSRAINAGRRGVTTEGMLITPADYLFSPDVIARVGEVLDQHPWWGPFHSVRQVPQRDTRMILRGHPDSGDGQVWPFCVPGIAVRTDVFDDVGGMDGRFAGWGPEDAALRHKLHILHGAPPPPEFPVAELWCHRDGTPNREANEALFAEYTAATTPEAVRALIAGQP